MVVRNSPSNVAPKGPARPYTIDAVDTAIALLMLLTTHADIGLSELARLSGHSKARVFRLIKTLEGRGLVAQSSDNRTYRLGYAALILGGAAAQQMDLVQIGQPILAELTEAIGETAQLRIVQGEQSVCVATWEPTRELRVNALIGRRRPLYRGTNKILLAYSPIALQDAVADKLSDVEQEPAQHTPVTAAMLREDLARIRAAGYWVSHGDMNRDLSGVGAPVFGPDKKLAAAINISAPSARLTPLLDQAISAVRNAADKLTSRLGGHA